VAKPAHIATVLVVVATTVGSGCVTLYQPMGSLQRPTLLNPADATFAGSRILLRCMPSDDLPPGDAEKVCRNLSQSLRAQGADTETIVPRALDDGQGRLAFDGVGADFTIEVASKTEHAYDYPAMAIAAGLTLTAVPAIEEETYAQTITVRGKNQVILASDTFRARFVTYTGCLVWSINALVDWLFRDDDNDLTGDVANVTFSKDFYRQVSQLAWNARVRSDVLGLTAPSVRALPSSPSPPLAAPAAPPATSPPPATTSPPPPSAPPPPPPPEAPPPPPPEAPPPPPEASPPSSPSSDPADDPYLF
jgi:hypothetical protein